MYFKIRTALTIFDELKKCNEKLSDQCLYRKRKFLGEV